MIRIGVQSSSLRQPIRQALHTVARLGASGVEIDARHELSATEMGPTALRDFRKKLDDLGLATCSVTFPTRRGLANPDQLDRRIEAIQQAMRLAADLGAKHVCLHIGAVSEEDESASGTLLESLEILARHGQHWGVVPAAMTDAACSGRLGDLLSEFPEGMLGIDWNPAGVMMAGEDPAELLRQLGQHVVHVRPNDAVRDLGMGATVGVQLGRGSVDLPQMLGILEEWDYRGWMTVERKDTANPIAEVGAAVEYLKNVQQ